MIVWTVENNPDLLLDEENQEEVKKQGLMSKLLS